MFIRNLSLGIQLFHHSVTEESQTMYIFFLLKWRFQVQTEIMCTGTSLFNVIICFQASCSVSEIFKNIPGNGAFNK